VQLADEAGIATLNKLAHIIWPITFKDILKPYNIDPILITPEILSRFNIITD